MSTQSAKPRAPIRPAPPTAAFVAQALDAAAIVAATDLRGRITHCNDRFCQVSGYARDELIGANHRILNSGTHPPGFFRAMYASIAAGQVWKGTICNRSKSGKLYWVDTTVVPHCDAHGRVRGYLAIRVDVTPHMQALQALAEARTRAELALDVKARFVANMSHELRTPLSGIIGMARMLADSHLDDDQIGFVRAIEEASASLAGLVNDVLNMAQLEAGGRMIAPKAVDLEGLLGSVVSLLTPRAVEKGLSLSLSAAELPAFAQIDPLRLRQVVTNLVGNAIKFTDRGSVRVEASWSEGRLSCQVIDTGRGFDPSQTERLFRAFEQGEEALSRSFGGAGLGLAISRDLVQAMGGEIHAESEPGVGSCFRFEVAAPRAQRPRMRPPLSQTSTTEEPMMSVLIAEDNPMIQRVVKHMVEAMDCKVTLVDDGLLATDAVRERRFDLCLMDLRMPRMDGRAAAAVIRDLPNGRGLPIVAVSADLLDSAGRVQEMEGFDGFIAKPVRPELLAAVISERRRALRA